MKQHLNTKHPVAKYRLTALFPTSKQAATECKLWVWLSAKGIEKVYIIQISSHLAMAQPARCQERHIQCQEALLCSLFT